VTALTLTWIPQLVEVALLNCVSTVTGKLLASANVLDDAVPELSVPLPAVVDRAGVLVR